LGADRHFDHSTALILQEGMFTPTRYRRETGWHSTAAAPLISTSPVPMAGRKATSNKALVEKQNYGE
jgi:hypothetical protein